MEFLALLVSLFYKPILDHEKMVQRTIRVTSARERMGWVASERTTDRSERVSKEINAIFLEDVFNSTITP